MDFNNFRALYPVTERYAFLNHAAVSPLSTRAAEVMQAYVEDVRDNATLFSNRWRDACENARVQAARLLNASTDEIAFVRNTAHGLSLVAAGMRWQEGDNVVTAEIEYPSNVYPWMNLERRGVETRLVPARDGRVLVEDVAACMDHRTRLVAISFVEFGSGFRTDLAALAELCHARNAFFCVDAIQGLGALPLDVKAMGIDFLSAGGHKWLLGPLGTGLFYIDRARLDDLDVVIVGLGCMADPDFFHFDSPFCDSARRFEEGAHNQVGLLGLGASLETLLEVGIPRIEQKILGLTGYLLEGLSAKNVTVITPQDHSGERSGIVSFVPNGQDPVAMAELMKEEGVIISQRGNFLRASPHFYNNETDIDRLLGLLPDR